MSEVVRLPAPLVTLMPVLPGWSKNKAVAHTLPYDAALMAGTQAGRPLPVQRWASFGVPALVLYGGKSPAWVQAGTKALAEALPGARLRMLPGQTHYVKAEAIAPVLHEFFANAGTRA